MTDSSETQGEAARAVIAPALELAKQLFVNKMAEYRTLMNAADEDIRRIGTVEKGSEQESLIAQIDAQLAAATAVKEQADGLQRMILQTSNSLGIASEVTADFFHKAYKGSKAPTIEQPQTNGPAVMEVSRDEAREETESLWI